MNFAHSLFLNHLWHRNPLSIPSSNERILPQAFYIITIRDGIYLLEYDEDNNKYNSTQVTENNKEEYSRGEMSSEGIYAVGGHSSNNIKIFNMTQKAEKQIKLKGTFSTNDKSIDCFFMDTSRVICCTSKYLKAIDLETMTQSYFYNATTHDFTACTQGENKNIYTAGPGQIEIIKPDGNELLIYRYGLAEGENQEARTIEEIRPNNFVTVDIDAYTVHNMSNLGNIISIRNTNEGYNYYTVIALQSSEGSFALGGEFALTDYANNGFVFIMNLEDKQSLSTTKFIDNLQGDLNNINRNDCRVQVIKEIQLGTIIFGVEFCDRFCIWNYVDQNSPHCINVDFISDYRYGISDIIYYLA